MTAEQKQKLTFKSIADKYNLFEEDVERIFACYDTNDLQGMEEAIGYCFFCSPRYTCIDLMFDIIRYIKQCELEVDVR